jgi:hypothetical protein
VTPSGRSAACERVDHRLRRWHDAKEPGDDVRGLVKTPSSLLRVTHNSMSDQSR